MASPFLPLSLAAALGAGLTYGVVQSPQMPGQHVEAFDAGVQNTNATTWLLHDVATDDICLIEKTRQITASTSTLDVDLACDTVMPEGNKISVWQQDEAGNVVLGDEQGRPVISFETNVEGELIASSTGKGRLVLSPGS